ncbi:MAG: acyltransferase family protein [Clostridiales bacterium]|nr:acyltransferase family protein [Clostridiales bacterium]
MRIKSTGVDITKEESRDYLFDNVRAILITLVVWGHLLTSMIYDYSMIKSVYYFIFFFHMPAMTFISGYFSKDLERSRSKAFEGILMPYLILNIINYIFKMLIIREDYFGFRFFTPTWGLWYLFTLFLWKFFLKDLVKIRFLLPFSFLLGIFSGFSREFSSTMALGRAICFFPFFLLGYYCTKEHLARIRRVPKLIPIIILMITGVLAYVIVRMDLFETEVLYLKKPYPQDSELKYMGYRILVYLIAIGMTVSIFILTSSKKSFLSKIGTSTMTVYILHLFTIPLLEKLRILNNKPFSYIIYSVFMTALIVFVYSRPFVKRVYDKFIDSLIRIIIRKV